MQTTLFTDSDPQQIEDLRMICRLCETKVTNWLRV